MASPYAQLIYAIPQIVGLWATKLMAIHLQPIDGRTAIRIGLAVAYPQLIQPFPHRYGTIFLLK